VPESMVPSVSLFTLICQTCPEPSEKKTLRCFQSCWSVSAGRGPGNDLEHVLGRGTPSRGGGVWGVGIGLPYAESRPGRPANSGSSTVV